MIFGPNQKSPQRSENAHKVAFVHATSDKVGRFLTSKGRGFDIGDLGVDVIPLGLGQQDVQRGVVGVRVALEARADEEAVAFEHEVGALGQRAGRVAAASMPRRPHAQPLTVRGQFIPAVDGIRREPEIRFGAVHVLLGDGDARGHGRPIRIDLESASEVGGLPTLGGLDDLNAEIGGLALPRDAVTETLEAALGVRLAEGKVSGFADVAPVAFDPIFAEALAGALAI